MASQNSAGLMVTFIDYCKCKSCLVPRLPVLYKLVLYKLVFIVQLENTRLYSSQQDLKWASTLYLLFRSCWKEYSLVFQVGTVKSSLNRMGSLGTRRENVVSLLPKTTLQARMQEGGMLCGGCVFVITYMYKCRPASAEMWSIDCLCFVYRLLDKQLVNGAFHTWLVHICNFITVLTLYGNNHAIFEIHVRHGTLELFFTCMNNQQTTS